MPCRFAEALLQQEFQALVEPDSDDGVRDDMAQSRTPGYLFYLSPSSRSAVAQKKKRRGHRLTADLVLEIPDIYIDLGTELDPFIQLRIAGVNVRRNTLRVNAYAQRKGEQTAVGSQKRGILGNKTERIFLPKQRESQRGFSAPAGQEDYGPSAARFYPEPMDAVKPLLLQRFRYTRENGQVCDFMGQFYIRR